MRQRHWVKIESLLNHKFKPDVPVTLELLENLNVFSYPNEFMEVSGQASSEAGLESLLRKVKTFLYEVVILLRVFFRLKNLGKLWNSLLFPTKMPKMFTS